MYAIQAKSALQRRLAERQLADAGAVPGDFPGEAEPYDEVSAIMAYEQGDLYPEEVAELFQHLIDNGHAWTLQGHYGRTAQAMIEAGECHA
ncbi:MAG: DUF7417 domain-containing protein [Acidiferrobacteraceae bacterium]